MLDKVYQAYSYKREIGDLEEDKAIAQANTDNANNKPNKNLLPMPDGKSPVAKPEMPKQRINPLDEIYNARKN